MQLYLLFLCIYVQELDETLVAWFLGAYDLLLVY
jgi:hypothetical protein